MSNYSIVDVIQFMTNNSLLLYKEKGSQAPLDKRLEYQKRVKKQHKGAIYVSPSKEDLVRSKGWVVTSYETLSEQLNQISHWTPNTYLYGEYEDRKNRILKGFSKEKLKQINVFGFDIDTKNVDLYAIFSGCEALGLPWPNVLLETPRGFQFFFVLDTPFFIKKTSDPAGNTRYKALEAAERIYYNLKHALSEYLPVDIFANGFGFFRIPSSLEYLRYFDPNQEKTNTRELINWSMDFEKKQLRENKHLSLVKTAKVTGSTIHKKWVSDLINNRHVQGKKGLVGRNNLILTLALAHYESGVEQSVAFDTLDQFNSNLENPLSHKQVAIAIKSAYSGKYHGVSRLHAEELIAQWGQSEFISGRQGWYKHAKEREDRVRSHYEEWEADLIAYIEKNTTPEEPFCSCSLAEMSKRLGMALSSLKETLKRSKTLIKRTTGRGRASKTVWSTSSMMFKAILAKRQKRTQQMAISFAEMLPDFVLQQTDLPSFDHLIKLYEVDLLYESKGSPGDYPRSRTG